MRYALIIAIVASTVLILATRPVYAKSDSRDALRYGRITLEPGDVISFRGGGATTGGLLIHGHASMYLGYDPASKTKIFLDFSVTKGGLPEIVFGTPAAFNGRIMPERSFLTYNMQWHDSFDVYRLTDRSTLSKRKLIRAAKIIAQKRWFGLSGTVCSEAVAEVLSKATSRHIKVVTPDGFESAPFVRHPQQGPSPVNIRQILVDLGRLQPPAIVPAPAPANESFLTTVARIAANQPDIKETEAARANDIRHPDTSAERAASAERSSAAWQYLRSTLQLACVDPDNLKSLRAQRRIWGVVIARETVNDFYSRDAANMGACERQMVDAILSSSGPAEVDWIERQGRKYYSAEQRRLRKQRKAAERAAIAAAEQKGRAQAHENYVRAETRLTSDASEHTSSGNAHLGNAYRQAVEISGGDVGVFDGR